MVRPIAGETPSVEKYAPSTASAARSSVVKDEATAGVNDADAEMLVKEVCAARRSWKSGRDIEPLTKSPSYRRHDDDDAVRIARARIPQED